jgi:hypothetical protein
MGVKNVNFLEQHVEKIVLGVAVAGAAFMGYLSLQPVSIEGATGVPVRPDNVEKVIADELRKVQLAQDKLSANPSPKVENYLARYNSQAQGQPLDATLVASAVPLFGPRNMPLSPVESVTTDYQIVAPAPVGPEKDKDPEKTPLENRVLRAQVNVVQVNTTPPQVDANGLPIPLEAGKLLLTSGVTVAVIDGYVPVGEMLLDMLNTQNKDFRKAVPPALQKAVVYRIEVSRQEQLPGAAGWSEFKVVPLPKGAIPPVDIAWDASSDLAQRMADVEANFKQIMLPDFYRREDGIPLAPPILTRPLPRTIDEKIQSLTRELDAARNAGMRLNPGAAPGFMTPTATAASGTLLPTTVEQLRTLPVQPFTVWDETVLPDHKYKYQVEVKLVNPVFGLPGAANKKLQAQPLLTLGPVAIPGQVVVHSDIAFFIQYVGDIAGANSRAISGKIYKQDNGRWYNVGFSSPIGTPVDAKMTLSAGYTLVDTKFTVVDFQLTPKGAHVILRDPTGTLVTREIPDDWNKKERTELDDRVRVDAAAAVAAVAATATAPAMPMVTTGPATRGAPVTPRTPVPVTPGPPVRAPH